MDESVQKQLAEIGTKKLKLSQAMRIGCLMHPQGYASFYCQGRTCAYGAAAYGAGYNGKGDIRNFIVSYFGEEIFDNAHNAIAHSILYLNDVMGETREKIAARLEAVAL